MNSRAIAKHPIHPLPHYSPQQKDSQSYEDSFLLTLQAGHEFQQQPGLEAQNLLKIP